MDNVFKSVGDPVKKFQPIIPPMTACDVETGSCAFVMKVTARPTANATEKLPARAFTEPSSFIVFVVHPPLITEPSITKIPAMMAAVLNLTIFETTAVPKTFTAWLAPNDQPRKSPLVMKNQTEISNFIRTF